MSSLITSSTVYNYKWIKHKFLLLQTVTLDIQLPEESEKAEIETLPHEEKLTAIINVLSQALKEGKSGQWIQKWKNTSNEYYCPLQWMLWCFLKTISWMYMYKLCESNLFLCMSPDVLKFAFFGGSVVEFYEFVEANSPSIFFNTKKCSNNTAMNFHGKFRFMKVLPNTISVSWC